MSEIQSSNQKIKVLIMSSEKLTNYPSYTNKHVEYLYKELKKEIDVEVDICAVSPPIPEIFENFIQDLYDGGDFSEIKKNLTMEMKVYLNDLRKKIKDFDIIHIQHANVFFQGIMAKLFFEKKVVITAHSLMIMWPHLATTIGEKTYQQSLIAEKVIFEIADCIITTYNNKRQDLLKGYTNIKPTKVSVVYNGVDTEEFRFQQSLDVLKKYNIDPASSFVILSGLLQKKTDFEYIKGVIEKLKPSLQIVFWVFFNGNDEFEDEFKQLIQEKSQNRPGLISINEEIEKSEKRALYSHSSAICCPLPYEPSSFTLLESLACGAPVVANAIGVAKEIVKHGENGFLIDPGISSDPPFEPSDKKGLVNRIAQATNRVVQNRALNRRLSLRSNEVVEQIFSWNTNTKKIIKLYEKILDSK